MEKVETRVVVDGFVFRNLKKAPAFNCQFDVYQVFFNNLIVKCC